MPSDRLDDLRVIDPVLTGIANDYQNSILIGTKLFPRVKVSKMVGKVPSFGIDAFVVRETMRAIRADSNYVPTKDFSMVDYDLHEYDIAMRVDNLELSEADRALKYETRIVKDLRNILDLQLEKAIATMAQDPAQMTANVDLNNAWATPATGTPIANIKTGKEAIRTATGVEPNTMLISKNAFELMILCDEVTAYITYSGFTKVTKDIISQLIDIPNIYIGTPKYSANGSSLTDLWTDSCVLAYVDQADGTNASEFNPSFGYTFQKEGYPQIDTYTENGGKIKVIRNTDIYVPKIIGVGASYLIYDIGG